MFPVDAFRATLEKAVRIFRRLGIRFHLEHPELKAIGQNGQPVGKFGIGCWGHNLCPSKPESQQFMLEYVREMFFDFYPNADGLMVESSDYAICHCPDCGERFFEKEFRFVRQISDEIWAKKPEAMIVVYPHYFSGAEVPGFGVQAAKLPFDSRWTLFFTPHSAHLDPELIRRARHSLWWDESPALRRPQDIQQGAVRARNAGVTGYVPSLEAYSFVPTEAEEGQEWLKGRRQVPLGFSWLKDGEPPYDELPMRVNRIAYREFSDNPDLSFERFKEKLEQEVFGDAATSQLVDDLLELQAMFATERSWCQPSPVVCPERVRAMKVQGMLTSDKRDEYRATLTKLRAIDERHQEAKSEGERQLLQIARWVLTQWTPENQALLEPTPSLHQGVNFLLRVNQDFLPHVVELRQRFTVIGRGWALCGDQAVGESIFRGYRCVLGQILRHHAGDGLPVECLPIRSGFRTKELHPCRTALAPVNEMPQLLPHDL